MRMPRRALEAEHTRLIWPTVVVLQLSRRCIRHYFEVAQEGSEIWTGLCRSIVKDATATSLLSTWKMRFTLAYQWIGNFKAERVGRHHCAQSVMNETDKRPGWQS